MDNTNLLHNLEDRFADIFKRLLSGEKIDLYAEDVSVMFEVIAKYLLANRPHRTFHWYDGVSDLTAKVRKSRQVQFTGEMWVGDDGGKQWKEDFRSTVTDKSTTKQGIWIMLWIGADKAEGNLRTAFNVEEESS